MSQNIKNEPEEIQTDSNESVIAVANSLSTRGGKSTSETGTFTGIAQTESIEPTNSTDNILVLLNDDCMIQIFEYLPLSDLCNLADVCRVFESNALSVFKRKHSDVHLLELLIIEAEKIEYKFVEGYVHRFPYKTIEKLFRHFGVYIKTLDLTDCLYDERRDDILEWMAAFCTHEDCQLSELVMNDVTIEPDLIPRIRPLFDRLKYLDVTGPGGSISAFYIGPQLTELRLEDLYLDEEFKQKFEKLHTLSLYDVRGSRSGESFMKMATQVKHLTIDGSMCFRRMAELEEFELNEQLKPEDTNTYFNPLAQWRYFNLKSLTLNCMGLSISKLLNNFAKQYVPIEELYLTNYTLTVKDTRSLAGLNKMKKLSLADGGWQENVQLWNVIKKMPNLEKLYLSGFGCVTIDVIKKTIENAPKLNMFGVSFGRRVETFAIGKSGYSEICELIKKRLDKTKLTLEVRGMEIQFFVPKYIVDMNSLWLEVVIVTFDVYSPYSEYSSDSD